MQKPVDAAKVHEHAEVSDVFDRSRADLTFLDVLEEVFLQALALFFQELAA